MKFNDSVVLFDFVGIPMVGNMNTGYVIGLTPDGAELSRALKQTDMNALEIASVDESLFKHLQLGGFFDETPTQKRLVSAYLHVTQRCNLDCVGCYSLDDLRNKHLDASLSDWKHALDQLTIGGINTLIISGGEPFLRDDLAEIVIYAKEICAIKEVVVLSNGTCLNPDALQTMAPYVDKVSVSFDGWSSQSVPYIRGKQRFTELVEAIEAIKSAGIKPHMIATIHKKNAQDVSKYSKLAEDLGASLGLSLFTCTSEADSLNDLLPDDSTLQKLAQILFEQGNNTIKILDAPVSMNLSVKHYCGAAQHIISVSADGTVYPCHMLQYENLSMGNLFTSSIEDVLSSDTARRFKTLKAAEFSDCSDCTFTELCGGGCRGRSLSGSGKIDSGDSYCSMIAAFYENLGARLNSMYQVKGRG